MKTDVCVIGGGGAAFGALTRAAELGLSAVLVNQGLPLGGTCLNTGCVPSKLLLDAANERWLAAHPRHAGLPACTRDFNFPALIREKTALIQRNRLERYQALLDAYPGVTHIPERAALWARGRVSAGGQEVQASAIVVATGCSPRRLELAGLERLEPGDLLYPLEAFELEQVPRSLLVLGGGATGLEVAQMFAHFGTKVTLLQTRDRRLPTAEPEISSAVERHFRDEGIEIFTSTRSEGVSRAGGQIILEADCKGDKRRFTAEKIFVSIGMTGNSRGMGLENAGIKTDANGFVLVDGNLWTGVPGIYAAGDVAGNPLLEPVAAREGYLAVGHAFGAAIQPLDYDQVPTAVFTEPQAAMVGLTEAEAAQLPGGCDCRVVDLARVPKADLTLRTEGLVKMVVEASSHRILGFHAFSAQAAEFIHEASLAIALKMTVEDVQARVQVFPTYAEAFKIASLAFKMDVTKIPCCI